MKKLFDKDETWFAVAWIVVYVVGFSLTDNWSEQLLLNKLSSAGFGLVLSGLLLAFARKYGLGAYFGLKAAPGSAGKWLYYIPFVMLGTLNLWFGVQLSYSPAETAAFAVSMCCVGLLEELIMRGFLFRAMARDNLTVAIAVCSLTFGMGHIVNLLNGAPVFETLCQIVYATAIGFSFTAFFCVSGSLVPCILTHIAVDVLSIFARDVSDGTQIAVTVFITVLSAAYGFLLLRMGKRQDTEAVSG